MIFNSFISTLLILAIAITTTHPATSQQAGDQCFSDRIGPAYGGGKCVPYSGLCKDVVGSVVFEATGVPTASVELWVTNSINTARKQSGGILSDACMKFTDQYTCRGRLSPCINNTETGEGMPILLCKNTCVEFWETCNVPPLYPFDAYAASEVSQGRTLATSQIVSCNATGTFTKYPQPADTFGGRSIPGWPNYPAGVSGVDIYPSGWYWYTLKDNVTKVELQCTDLDAAARAAPRIVLAPVVCSPPLMQKGAGCVMPCPFPVIPQDQLQAVAIAYYVPGIIGFIACILGFLDASWQIIESTGCSLSAIRSRYLTFKRVGSSSATSSAGVDSPRSGNHQQQHAAKRSMLRAATLHHFIAAILGIVYFVLGPLGSIEKGSMIECPAWFDPQNVFDTAAVYGQSTLFDGPMDYSDATCRAQRASPFVLQAIFNLILYSLFKVFLVVNDRASNSSHKIKTRWELMCLAYCIGVPVTCLAITFVQFERPNQDLVGSQIEWSRQAAVCFPRFNNNVQIEFALVFLPYIITGFLVVILSFFTFLDLYHVRQKTKGLMSATGSGPSSSTVALNQLISRLAILAIATLCLLIVLVVTTSINAIQTTAWAPAFSTWNGCQQSCACPPCDRCIPSEIEYASKTPSAVNMGIQVFASSSIVMLVGMFFLAQSVARLRKEHKDGVLKDKIKRVCACNGSAGKNSSSVNSSAQHDTASPNKGGKKQLRDESFAVTNYPVSGEEKSQVATSSVRGLNDQPVAAYMDESASASAATATTTATTWKEVYDAEKDRNTYLNVLTGEVLDESEFKKVAGGSS